MRLPHWLTGVLAAAGSLVVKAAPVDDVHGRQVDFKWGSDKVRGVNLGGWLVIEAFITPSIFESHSTDDKPIIDEWTLCATVGQANCSGVLKPHWDSFVTVADFWKIKNAGFNVVRIPVGYWSYVEPWGPYAQGAAPYVDAAIDWARQTGLKVVIDLHGAPKSQNGFDHSGHRQAEPGWGDADSLEYTHRALRVLEEKYAVPAMQDVVVSMQPLNEPLLRKLDRDMVRDFYRDAYDHLRQRSDTPILLHDGFEASSWMNGFLTPQQDIKAQNVIVDHHEYQVFDRALLALSVDQHVGLTCDSADSIGSSDKWTIVGEWSAALTDCAKHVNGFAAGHRYDGSYDAESSYIGTCAGRSGRVDTWSQAWKDSVRKYIEVQLDVFEARTQGWMFWNFKTEGSAGDWDLFQLLDGGVFPQPLWDRKFGHACTGTGE
ncbi:glucan exo-1,3-beta-glucosidase [Pleosporales sp. CAS-2024a]